MFHRISHILENVPFDESWYKYAAACAILGIRSDVTRYNLLYDVRKILRGWRNIMFITEEQLLQYERLTMQHLSYIMLSSPLYNHCKYKHQVRYIFNEIIMNPDVSLYLKTKPEDIKFPPEDDEFYIMLKPITIDQL